MWENETGRVGVRERHRGREGVDETSGESKRERHQEWKRETGER